jgi:hypothetical protein
MRALRVSLIVLVLAVLTAAGCSNCPIHKALFGSDEEEAAPEAVETEEQAAHDVAILPPAA